MTRWPWLSPLVLAGAILLGLVTAAAALIRPAPPPLPAEVNHEQFDPYLAGLDSVDEIMFVLDTTLPNGTALQKLDQADKLLRRRFVHSYSYFRTDHDWLAASLHLIWSDLASPVLPDDILKFRRAACSQQSMVFQEIATRLGFDQGTVAVPGHFLAAAKIDGEWWVYDANKEVKARRYPLSMLYRSDPRLVDLYGPQWGQKLQNHGRRGEVVLRDINRFAAPQAGLLHRVTKVVSHYGWLILLGLWLLLRLGSASGGRAAPGEAARVAQPPQMRVRAASN